MSWQDDLQQASFRGVPFKVESTDTGVGRRNVVHQYPFSDEPYVEDLGADADDMSITGYVIQNKDNKMNYFAERDALIDALKSAGPGKLVHPFLGEMTVDLIGKARITEAFAEGGIARFTMTFSQTGVSTLRAIAIANTTSVDDAVENAEDAVQDNFVSTYKKAARFVKKTTNSITTAFGMVKRVILSVRDAIAPTIAAALAKIDEYTANISDVVDSASGVMAIITDTHNEVLKLVGLPDSIIGATIGMYSGRYRGELVRLPGDKVPSKLGASIIHGLISLNRFGEATGISTPSVFGGQLEPITVSDYATAEAALTQATIIHTNRNAAIIAAAKVAVRVDYECYEDALSITSAIAGAIDSQLEAMSDEAASADYSAYGLVFYCEDTHTALEDLRAAFLRTMKNIGASLAHNVDYDLAPEELTTLVLAYNQYNDVTRDAEIMERNRTLITNPALMPVGSTISILSE